MTHRAARRNGGDDAAGQRSF